MCTVCLIYTVWWSHRNMRRVGQRRKIKQLARLRMKNKGIRAIMPFKIQVFMKSTNRPKWKRIRIMGMAMANDQAEQLIIARWANISLISQTKWAPANFLMVCSFHLVVNAPIRTWIHRELKVKIVNQRHRCNGIIPTFIYLQSRANHRVMFECIMRHVIVLMPDKGHYFAFNQNQIPPNTKCTLRFTYNNNNYSPNVPKTFNSLAFVWTIYLASKLI